MAPLFAMLPAHAADGSNPMRLVGKIPVDSPQDRTDGSTGGSPIIVNSGSRRALMLFDVASNSIGNTRIRSIDLDSMRPVGSALVPRRVVNDSLGGFNMMSNLPYAVDEKQGLVFLATLVPNWTVVPGTSATGEVIVLDGRLIEKGRDPVIGCIRPPANDLALRQATLRGMSVHRDESDRLKLLVHYNLQSDQSTFVAQWDVDNALRDMPWRNGGCAEPLGAPSWVDWPAYRVKNCRNPITFQRSQVAIGRTTDGQYVYTSCLAGAVSSVRLTMGPTGPLLDEVFAGPESAEIASLSDPTAGRLHLAAGPAYGVRELWTFDVASGRWVGRAGLSVGPVAVAGDSFGIDSTSGRVYSLAPNTVQRVRLTGGRNVVGQGGLLVIDGRLTPVPQALVFNEFAYPSIAPIQIDPGNGRRPARVFVRRGPSSDKDAPSGGKTPERFPTYPEGKLVRRDSEPFWSVIQDAIPVARARAPRDLDRFTVDIPEKAGTTLSSFESSAGGYAIRIRTVGGLRSVTGTPKMDTFFGEPEPSCWGDTREVTMAVVEDVQLTPYQSNAKAAPLDSNESNAKDIEAPATRCQPRRQPEQAQDLTGAYETLDAALGQKWTVEAAECQTEGESTKEWDSLPAPESHDYAASATCVPAQSAHADATATPVQVGAPIERVGSSGSSADVLRDSEKGVVASSEAWVTGVDLAAPNGSVRLDLIHAQATAWSNGRRASERSRGTFSRTICWTASDQSQCYRELHGSGCEIVSEPPSGPEGAPRQLEDGRNTVATEHDEFCGDEVAALAKALNRGLGGRWRVRVPNPDPAYLRGSPGGYVAGVQKGAGDQYDDSLQNGDFSYDVPALELIRESDKGRQVIQFAAVRAVSTYQINCAPPLTYVAKSCVLPAAPDFALPAEPGIESHFVPVDTGREESPPSIDEEPAPTVPTFGDRTRVLIVRSAAEGAFAASVWFVLLLPLILAGRRRAAVRTVDGSP